MLDLDEKLKKASNNVEVMRILFETKIINAQESEILYKVPSHIEQIRLSKIEGALLGTSIGDILGNKVESKLPEFVIKKFGDVKGFLRGAHYTDDTQLMFWTLDVILKNKRISAEDLAKRLTSERIIGIGKSTKQFIRNFKDLRVPWYYAGVQSAGNGALVRIPPIVIPYLIEPSSEMWADAVVSTMVTHNDHLAISSAVAFTHLLWEVLKMNKIPEPEWWVEEYIYIAREVEGDNTLYKPRNPNITYIGPAWAFIEKVLLKALNERWSLYTLNRYTYSGAYLLETIPVVLYSLMLFSYDSLKAVSKAVTNSKDSDSIGAVVGYMVGALNGSVTFPKHILEPVVNKLPKNFKTLIEKALRFILKENKKNGNKRIVHNDGVFL